MSTDYTTLYLGTGELCSGPMSSAIEIWATAEVDGSYTLTLQGEQLEPGDPPLEMEPQSFPDVESTLAALREMGLTVEVDELPRWLSENTPLQRH